MVGEGDITNLLICSVAYLRNSCVRNARKYIVKPVKALSSSDDTVCHLNSSILKRYMSTPGLFQKMKKNKEEFGGFLPSGNEVYH